MRAYTVRIGEGYSPVQTDLQTRAIPIARVYCLAQPRGQPRAPTATPQRALARGQPQPRGQPRGQPRARSHSAQPRGQPQPWRAATRAITRPVSIRALNRAYTARVWHDFFRANGIPHISVKTKDRHQSEWQLARGAENTAFLRQLRFRASRGRRTRRKIAVLFWAHENPKVIFEF